MTNVKTLAALSILTLSGLAYANMDEPGVLVGTKFCLGQSSIMVDQDSVNAFGPTLKKNLEAFVIKRSTELGLLTAGMTQANSCVGVVQAFKASPQNPRPAVLLVVLEATPPAEDGSTRALMVGMNVLAQDGYSKAFGVLWQKISIMVAGDAMDGTVTLGAVEERVGKQLEQLKVAWVNDQKK